MPSVHITRANGAPLDLCDGFGSDMTPQQLMEMVGRNFRLSGVTVDEIVFDVIQEMPATWPPETAGQGEGL